MKPRRRLVINADDFGLAPGVSRAIVEAHLAGSVTSASLMVNLPGFQDALDRLHDTPSLGVGLHFNLTAGPPACPADRVPSLVDRRTGHFHPLPALVARTLTGRIRSADVERECAAQLALLHDAGIMPTHLDSHRHVHMLPGIGEPVRATAARAGIRAVRVPFERMTKVFPRVGASAEQAALRAAGRLAGAGGARGPVDHFRGSALFSHPDFEAGLLKVLGELEPGTTELMVHPGHDDPEILRWDSYATARELEWAALLTPAVRERLTRGDIELVNFGDLRCDEPGGATRISVVIPAYNEAAYLPALLDSIDVARAAYGRGPDAVEVIVADNDSTDATAEIARCRGCRVVLERERVIAAVRNAGAAIAAGVVLAFVDADSVIDSGTFQAIDDALRAGVIGGATGVTMDSWSIAIALSVIFLRLASFFSRWDSGVVFCRREDFFTVAGFDTGMLFGEDFAFVRALRRLGFARRQPFVTLKHVRAVTSTRKFTEFGHGRWLLGNIRVLVLSWMHSPRARRFVEAYWYKVRS